MNLKKIINFIGNQNLFTGSLIVFGSIILIFFEMVGLGSIPIFISLIMDPEGMYERFPFLEKILDQSNFYFSSAILSASLIIFLVFLIKNVYSLTFLYYQDKFYANLRRDTAHRLLKKYLNQKYKFYLNNNSSILIRNIFNESKVAVSFVNFFLKLLKDGFLSLFLIIALLFVNSKIVFTIIIILSILLFVYYIIFRKKVFSLSKLSTKLRGQQFKYLNQIFNTIKLIKLRGNENYFSNKFSEANREEQKISLINSFIPKIPKHIIEVASISLLLVVIFYLTEINNVPFEESIPILTLFSLCFLRLIPAFNSISECMVYLRTSSFQFSYIVDQIIKLDGNSNNLQENNIEKKIENKKINFKKIIIKNLSFTYHDNRKLIFDNLNLEIPKNKNICIIGKTGEGKSTFADLLMGLLDPDSGEILADNENINKFLPSWKTKIGYIPQSIYLNDDTIEKNIAFGLNNSEIDKERLSKSIDLSEMKEFVNNLPDKTKTIVGEKGVNISGGQIQRIGIARAIYSQPDLLILDEATSSLDSETEKKIISQINRLKEKYTVITITHKKEVADTCDEVYEVKNKSLIKIR